MARTNNFSPEYLKDLHIIIAKLIIKNDSIAYNLLLNRVDEDENYYKQKNICDIDTLNYARKLLIYE